MEHDEEILTQTEHDALSSPADPGDRLAFDAFDGRIHGAEQEWAHDPHALEDVTLDSRAEMFNVEGDVGQLGYEIARRL